MPRIDKKAYKAANEKFLADMANDPEVKSLPGGILYRAVEKGDGKSPSMMDVVSVYYKGSLIDGKVFDDNTSQGFPDTFRLRELIQGWQTALTRMREGDRWILYIPAAQGYGSRGDSNIPANSTLIFDIKLVKVN
ncbi:MAG: FKBP-type peptidyl-prolyl cis-trans isomerase [Bacteroidales bacterium]|nr:FKBP-type peptidyl-prolyl cis-trans isomerase [Bacteroidales bacterium]MCD8393838.1 FKBP-type peptidyl-prolyl cis-trans isomerase [Bacteroidales bacterium]